MTNGTADPSPAHWLWAPGSDLVFLGGLQASQLPHTLNGWAILEAASAINHLTGDVNDFRFADLILAAGTHVSLVDYTPNHAPMVAAEVVYCDTLTLNSGAQLNLNGHSLFVGGIQVFAGPYGNGIVVDELRGISGDCNEDGIVNIADVSCYLSVLVGVDVDPVHRVAADLNRDGATDGRDIRPLVERILSP